MLEYPIKLTKDDNDTVLATSPDFPELTTFGDDNDDALLHAVDALEEAIAARMAHHMGIPEPSKRGKYRVPLPTQTAIKVLLYQAMMEEGLTKAQLARTLNWHGPQMDRLLNLNHSSRLEHVDAAFSALGRRVAIETVDAGGVLKNNRGLIVRLTGIPHNLKYSDIARICEVPKRTVEAWLKPPTSKSHSPPSAKMVEVLYLACNARLPLWFKQAV